MTERSTKSWQTIGGTQSFLYRVYDAFRRLLNRRLVKFLKRMALENGGISCEAGSGTAYGSSLLALRRGVTAVALDIDEEALIEAMGHRGRVLAVQGDVHSIPFRDETFDLVWSNSTFEHLEHQHRVIGEMSRVCKRNGCVFIGVPYSQGPLFFQKWIHTTGLGRWLGDVFSERQIEGSMRDAGLVPVRTIRYFLWVFVGSLARKPA
jgi:ubiquinone/menaquinone biosynthesis C-methylase UbiE